MSKPRCPAILIVAPASGQGKTTVTAALARLNTRQGRKVRVFKYGPDFLDPFWLSLASGAPVHSLDLWMTGRADCAERLHRAAQEADLILIEGVMGLFDGEPSAADLAQHFGIAVLAVIDASAMAGTFGALAFGLQYYRANLPWAGVLANKVASEGHAKMLEQAMQVSASSTTSLSHSSWQGALMRDAAFVLPERHLGLVSALEVSDAAQRLDAVADAVSKTPIGQMSPEQWQQFSVTFDLPEAEAETETEASALAGHSEHRPSLAGLKIAVARDHAFCFIYPANLDALEQLGAQLVYFSPLESSALPECDALWLPGGYPELHAERLAANQHMAQSIKTHIGLGKPVWAECGGMMALFETLITKEGAIFPMWGVFPGSVSMQQRLSALGPQQLEWDCGVLRGHTFHYSRCDTPLTPLMRARRMSKFAAVATDAAPDGEAVYGQGRVQASYFHAWFASSLSATAALFSPSPSP